jgi:hypothetical protein
MNSLIINFVGDIQLSGTIGSVIKNSHINSPFRNVIHELKNATFTIGNLEFPASKNLNPKFTSSQINFAVKPEHLKVLNDSGITHLSLANNHILDWGIEGIKTTQSILSEIGIKYFGSGINEEEANQVLIKNINGTTVALLAFCKKGYFCAKDNKPGATEFNIKNIVSKIIKLRDSVNFIIVLPHWGTEFSFYPDPEQISKSHKIIDAGADAIVGHHPHVLQGWEIYKDKPIFYSIGSFLYDPMSETVSSDKVLKERRTSMILRLSFNVNETIKTEIIPTFIDEDLNLSILGGNHREDVLKWLETVSVPIRKGDPSFFYSNVFKNIWKREIFTIKKLFNENGIRFIRERIVYLRSRHFRYVLGFLFVVFVGKLKKLWKTIFIK